MKSYNIPIFIPHEGCPHDCVFCNQRKITGVETSISEDDIVKTIEDYLKFIPKSDAAVEIAFFGGSFTGLSIDIQERFYKVAARYDNIVDGIRMSTRPDCINDDILSLAKKYNVRTIELGLQSSDDMVLLLNERGHKFSDCEAAAELIKRYDIALGLQLMVGMYGSTPEKDILTAKAAAELKPDCARIYQTVTLKNTKLEKLYVGGVYTPYDMDTAIDVTDEMMKILEDTGTKIIRVGLHSDESLLTDGNIVAGPYHPAFRELVMSRTRRNELEEEIKKKGLQNCTFEVCAPKNKVSEFVGHKRCNVKYFEEKYNINLVVQRQ